MKIPRDASYIGSLHHGELFYCVLCYDLINQILFIELLRFINERFKKLRTKKFPCKTTILQGNIIIFI